VGFKEEVLVIPPGESRMIGEAFVATERKISQLPALFSPKRTPHSRRFPWALGGGGYRE
jgi:hypothetical protein